MLFVARSHYDHEGVAVSRLSSLCLALDIVSCCLSLFGEPCPSLYKLKGRLTCRVLLGLELTYSLLQVGYKYGSCFLVKEIFLMPSVLSRPIITRPGLLGLGPLSSVWPAVGAIIKSPGSWVANLPAGYDEASSPAGSYSRPGHTAGYIPDISPQFNLDLSMLNWSCKINTRTNLIGCAPG